MRLLYIPNMPIWNKVNDHRNQCLHYSEYETKSFSSPSMYIELQYPSLWKNIFWINKDWTNNSQNKVVSVNKRDQTRKKLKNNWSSSKKYISNFISYVKTSPNISQIVEAFQDYLTWLDYAHPSKNMLQIRWSITREVIIFPCREASHRNCLCISCA